MHPFGHGMETYFWSFVVALMIFSLGGAVSIGAGVYRITHPDVIDHPWVNYLVLAASAVFEGASFLVSYREFRRVVLEKLREITASDEEFRLEARAVLGVEE